MKRLSIAVMLIILLVSGCAITSQDVKDNSQVVAYYSALTFFNGAWESYHKVWLTLPDEKKAEWVNEYHKYFHDATLFLDVWSLDPGNEKLAMDWQGVATILQTILTKLAIK